METGSLIVLIATSAVAIVLFAGIFNMFRGGEGSASRSQLLMRWRVVLQFVAIIVIMAVIYFTGQNAP